MSIEREPLVTHMFTADPSAHVFDGKIYIYIPLTTFLITGRIMTMAMSIR